MSSIPLWIRDGDYGPLENPFILVNLVCRLVLCPIAFMASWVPLKLLFKNGEFAATVMVVNNWILILFTFINATIWHDNEPEHWWMGYGWCDIQEYCIHPMGTLYAACVCAIMRRLSKQVGLMRIADLSPKERRNRLLIQSLILFPVPILQVALTILVQPSRYSIMAVNGCGKSYDANPILLIFFILPPPIFTVAACVHAVQTWRRFREVQETTRSALSSNNSTAVSRSQRAKRKLYLMTLCILFPYTILELVFLAVTVYSGWPWTKQYDFYQLKASWGPISTFKYDDVSFIDMNTSWIPVITVLVIIAFFGTGREAINIYRNYLLSLGLGRVFQKLKEDYNPDKARTQNGPPTFGTQHSEQSGKTHNTASTIQSHKQYLAPNAHHASYLSGTTAIGWSDSPNRSLSTEPHQALPSHTPLLTADSTTLPASSQPSARSHIPVTFSPGLNWMNPPKLRPLSMPSFFKKSNKKPASLPMGRVSTPASTQTPRMPTNQGRQWYGVESQSNSINSANQSLV